MTKGRIEEASHIMVKLAETNGVKESLKNMNKLGLESKIDLTQCFSAPLLNYDDIWQHP